MKAMIFAAGLGTRLQPLTNHRPKALVEVAGVPLLQHAIMALKQAGVDEIIVNVHHFADQIISFLEKKDHFGIRIAISDERQRLLETGGGLQFAQWFFRGDERPFFVYNADILIDIDLNNVYKTHIQENAIATLVTSKRQSARQLLFDADNVLHAWANVETGILKVSRMPNTDLFFRAFAGLQVLSPQFFEHLPQTGSEIGKFSIIDTYLYCAAQGEKVFGYDAKDAFWLDVGKPENVAVASAHLIGKTKNHI